MLNVAMVGLGDWGPNIARNLAVLPDVQLHTAQGDAEVAPGVLRRLEELLGRVERFGGLVEAPSPGREFPPEQGSQAPLQRSEG